MYILLKHKKYKRMKKLIERLNKQVDSADRVINSQLAEITKYDKDLLEVNARVDAFIDFIGDTYSLDKDALKENYLRGGMEDNNVR